MKKIKPFVLPSAILLGLLLHNFCAEISFLVPYIIFSILILNFATIELRNLRFTMLDFWLATAQIIIAIILYFITFLFTGSGAIPQGLMMCALCPVASSVTVVAMMLGAKKRNTIAFTICDNLLISAIAPIFFIIINGKMAGVDLTTSFFAILGKVATVIGLPFFVMLFIQLWIKPLASAINKFSGIAFYLWALALFLTLGQTIDFIFVDGSGKLVVIITLGIGAAVICALQFGLGRYIGYHFKDKVGGQQLLGQKNSAMGIWMANTYLNPLASVSLAFYSIWQNLFNSWQIWRQERNCNILCGTKNDAKV